MNRLQTKYNTQIREELLSELGLKNVHQIPRLEKVVLNVGVGKAVQDSKYLDTAVASLAKIAGQKPITTKAQHSIASYKLREGMLIGAKVTIRGNQMYAFIDRLIAIVLPRTRDFHGVSAKAFDKSGNYSIGISDHTVFPEISYEDTTSIHGLQITLVISGNNPEGSKLMLTKMGLPFEKGAS